MKKIIIISVVFPPEPLVSANLSGNITFELQKNGYQVTVLKSQPCRPYGFNFDKYESGIKGLKEITLNSYICPDSKIIGRFRENISFGKHCVEYIKRHWNDIDCIYLNTWPLFSQYMIVKCAKKFHIPTIVHVQDIYPESLVNKFPQILNKIIYLILLPIDKYTLNNATHILVISNNMKKILEKTRDIDDSKFTIVQNWQDEKEFIEFKKEPSIKKEKRFTFMYLGNIGPVAGIDLLIESFEVAKPQNARLVIAGSGSMKEKMKELVKKYNNKNIEFWDVPPGKVPESQDYADVMLLPVKKGASYSSIPSKLPAYMFSAKPIIACIDKDSDTAISILTANCGWVIKPEDKVLLSQLMKNVVSIDKIILSKMGLNGFQYAINEFSKKTNLNKVVKIINSTIPLS